MTDETKKFQLRMPIIAHTKAEYLARITNRSLNSMIVEMIESYELSLGGKDKFMGMSKGQYKDYLLDEFSDKKVGIFDFEISLSPHSYCHDAWIEKDGACGVSQASGCYAMIIGGEIVYVGSSENLRNRMYQRKSNGWIATGADHGRKAEHGMQMDDGSSVMFWFCSDYREAERDLIYALSPRFNKITPKHDGKSEYAISTDTIRNVFIDRKLQEGVSQKEIDSIEKILSMRAYT